ncbi:uncharacterized protein Z518_00506 [Rhinocladiella mackenziei CBS 650.93]|uniref:Serine hydrolase domain-containing protein n=1 Tax=Rhinocladiella mackenziei CBS 650.93 TaxID=1442369 RepID=A0A0D2J162_9EURO|nr:uncharacterized protein Z518_00506 [Rhinocladiella mackenziei CBS 650.93]KIX09426.1 hypothetical protein Z518_00506 [Rhinocladiella mackenziei CBS 650.93]
MRLLCLHGYGTNANVLTNQLSTFFSVADSSIEPVYIEGEVECPKARGLGAFATGPFSCYYDNFAPESVKRAHEMITEVIEEDGPFDGILGFSQGASLAAAYLLQHEIDRPDTPPPFKFAMIFSSIISFTPDESCCREIVDHLSDKDVEQLAGFPDADFSALPQDAKTLFQTMAKALSAGVDGGFLHGHPDQEVFRRRDAALIPRILHPELIKQRIRVPTVHVVGKKDNPFMLEQSQLVYRLCQEGMAKWLEHSAGHDVPRNVAEAKEAVKAMEWAAKEGEEQSVLCRL